MTAPDFHRIMERRIPWRHEIGGRMERNCGSDMNMTGGYKAHVIEVLEYNVHP